MRKQRTRAMPPPNKSSARSSQSPSSTRSHSRFRNFSVEVHIRGELASVQHALCTGLEEALHSGETQFPAFAERNPWLELDSLRRRIWILLDPEPASTSESIVRKNGS